MSFRRDAIWTTSSASAVVWVEEVFSKGVHGGSAGLAPACLPNGTPSSDRKVGTEVVPMCLGDSGLIVFVSFPTDGAKLLMRKSGLTRGSPNLVILCLRKGVSLQKIKFLQKGNVR